MPSIVVQVDAHGTKSVFRYDASAISIGSAASCDLVLPHESVGPKHARIHARKETGGFVVLHTDRLTNTLVAGEPVLSSTPVFDGDELVIGEYRVMVLDREPPRGEEAAFLDALDKRPSDDDTRVVYADWLEEHGQSGAAELIRAQLAIRALAATEPRFKQLSSRIRELAQTMPLSWRRAVARPIVENCDDRAEVACPRSWDSLTATDHPSRRHCGSCDQSVYYAPTIEIAREHVRLGRCIAVDVAEQRWDHDLAPPPPSPGGFVMRPQELQLVRPPPEPSWRPSPDTERTLPPPTSSGHAWKPDLEDASSGADTIR